MTSKKWFVDVLFYISVVGLILSATLMISGAILSRKRIHSSRKFNSDNSLDRSETSLDRMVRSNLENSDSSLSGIIMQSSYRTSQTSLSDLMKLDSYTSKDLGITFNTATINTHSRGGSFKKGITSSNDDYIHIENNKLDKLQRKLNAVKKRDAFLAKHRNEEENSSTNPNDDIYLYNKKLINAELDLIKISINEQENVIKSLRNIKNK